MEFQQAYPLIVMAIGIAIVIGMIMWFRINAFIALITAAIVVSLMAFEQDADGNFVGLASDAILRVAKSFGDACGNIGIVIGLAAVIGVCMMESGAADRIVRAFMNALGEKRAPWALMGSGYVLAVPVFFDTVFYLLVPLARSFYRRTGGSYLKCILAISAGGAITHTLVPPTPGPLTMAANMGIDLGKMIMVGAIVALPAAIAGIIFAGIADRMFDIPMREIKGQPESEPLDDDKLPGLFISLVPVLLPVLMIAIHTVTSTLSDNALDAQARAQAEAAGATLNEVVDQKGQEFADLQSSIATLMADETADETSKNAELYTLKTQRDSLAASAGVSSSATSLSRGEKLKAVRADVVSKAASNGESVGAATSLLRYTKVVGNPSLALLISTAIALFVYMRQRKPTKETMSTLVEAALMSAGVIILITAGGSAFGGMLKVAGVGGAIRDLFVGSNVTGMTMLFLGFGIAALLKVAQGSSTAAMIITSQMMAGMIVGLTLPYDKVYLATAIGAGSLVGSWMSDSGFWIFAKMGGLTEKEALSTWTPLLIVLGVTSMAMTLILANLMPLV